MMTLMQWILRRWKVLLGLGFVAVVVLSIVLPPLLVEPNPPVISEPNWDSPATADLVRRACADCHSNTTRWPWYSKAPGVALVVARHVQEGREKLNFSEWGMGRQEVDEVVEVIREGEMPPAMYVLAHPEARLTAAEKEQLISGLIRSLNLSTASLQDNTPQP